MRKAVLIILAILCACLLFLVLAKPQQVLLKLGPSIGDVVTVEARGNAGEVREEIALTVKNNLIPVHIDSMFIELELEDERVLSSNRNEALDLNILSKDTLHLAATLEHDKIYQILREAEDQNRDSLRVSAGGTVYHEFPLLGNVELPFSRNFKIRTPLLPEISLASLRVEEINLPDVNLIAGLEVVNRESLEVTIRQLDYRIRIDNGVILAEGTTGQNTRIEANDTTLLDVPVETSLGAVDDTIVQFIEEGTDWPVEIDTHVILNTGVKWFETVIMNMQLSDTVDVMEQAVK